MNSLKGVGIITTLLLTIMAYSQTVSRGSKEKSAKMKEYILIIRLPHHYGPKEAGAVRDKWNKLTDKWKADGIFITSNIFPGEGHVILDPLGNTKKEYVMSEGLKEISNIVISAENTENALALARLCPILEQGGTVEVREIQQHQQTNNKEAVRNLYENILNNRKLALLDDLISNEYTGIRGEKGVTGFKETVVSVINGFPDIKWTIEDLFAENDKVVVRWHWNGTNTAPFRGIPPSNKPVTDNAIAIYQFKDGKIINAWIQGDRLGVLTQIGVIPAGLVPGPPPSKK